MIQKLKYMSAVERQGRAEGAGEALRVAIIDFLKNISGTVPQEMIVHINEITCEDKLRALLSTAPFVKSFAEFEEKMGLDPGDCPSLKELKENVSLLSYEDFERLRAWIESFAAKHNAGRWKR
jgi:hypothetical protein